MASKSSEKGNDYNERLSKLEDKLKKFEYALTYYKLKSNDAPLLITGSADYTIKLWDLDKNECIKTLIGHTHSIDTLKIMKNGHLISGSRDKTIRIWNLTTGATVQILEGHKDSIYSFQLTNDNNNLITCSLDETIKIWNLETSFCIKTLKESFCIFSILLLDNDEMLASGLENGHIKIWNLKGDSNKSTVKLLNGHLQIVRALQKLDKRYLVSASDDKTIKLWDIDNGTCVRTYEGHGDSVLDIQIAKNRMLFSCSSDKTIKAWDLGETKCLYTLSGHESTIHAVIVMLNGDLVSCSKDKKIKIWNLKTKMCPVTITGHEDSVLCLDLMNSFI